MDGDVAGEPDAPVTISLVTVQAAGKADLPLLATVEDAADRRFVDRFGPLDWPPAPSGAERAARPGSLLVARTALEGPVVGFAHVLHVDGAAHLEQLAVLPESGRRGVGRALLGAVLRGAVERGAARVTLRTFADVPWNAPFYAAEGFQESEPDTAFLRGLAVEEEAAGIDRHGRRVQMTHGLTAEAPTGGEALGAAGAAGPGRTAEEVLALAARAMHELLTVPELALARAEVVVPAPPWAPVPGDLERVLRPQERIGDAERLLRITVLGEAGSTWVSQQWVEDDAELLARIRSDLQDFVAESAFGWGQLRE